MFNNVCVILTEESTFWATQQLWIIIVSYRKNSHIYLKNSTKLTINHFILKKLFIYLF